MKRARAWLALAAFFVAAAHAQAFPQRTVTLVVPYSAGGLPDTIARVVGQKLGDKWGQAVALAPDVATVDESAIPGFDFAPTIGISAASGIAAATVQKVSADVTDLLRDPALAERLTVLGIEPVGGPSQVYIDQIRADRDRFERAVTASGAKAE